MSEISENLPSKNINSAVIQTYGCVLQNILKIPLVVITLYYIFWSQKQKRPRCCGYHSQDKLGLYLVTLVKVTRGTQQGVSAVFIYYLYKYIMCQRWK